MWTGRQWATLAYTVHRGVTLAYTVHPRATLFCTVHRGVTLFCTVHRGVTLLCTGRLPVTLLAGDQRSTSSTRFQRLAATPLHDTSSWPYGFHLQGPCCPNTQHVAGAWSKVPAKGNPGLHTHEMPPPACTKELLSIRRPLRVTLAAPHACDTTQRACG